MIEGRLRTACGLPAGQLRRRFARRATGLAAGTSRWRVRLARLDQIAVLDTARREAFDRGLAKGEAVGLAKGEAVGLAKGKVIGGIQAFEQMLGRPETPVEQLNAFSLEELATRVKNLQAEILSRRQG